MKGAAAATQLFAHYDVLTWDAEAQNYTPQPGCSTPVEGFAGLRNSLRQLQQMSYGTERGNFWVRVKRVEPLFSPEDEAA